MVELTPSTGRVLSRGFLSLPDQVSCGFLTFLPEAGCSISAPTREDLRAFPDICPPAARQRERLRLHILRRPRLERRVGPWRLRQSRGRVHFPIANLLRLHQMRSAVFLESRPRQKCTSLLHSPLVPEFFSLQC